MKLKNAQLDDFERTSRILSNIPGLTVWQDIDAKFLCASEEAMATMGFRRFEEMFGYAPADMKNKFSELAEDLVKNNQYIIEQNCIATSIFSSHVADDEWGLFLGQQQPLLNEDGVIIGVSSQTFNITKSPLAAKFVHLFLEQDKKSAATQLKQGFYRYTACYEKLKLSKRQGECFFWVIRNKTASEIGALLNLNKRTVEAYISDIKKKFKVRTLAELTEITRVQGFESYIPQHWLP